MARRKVTLAGREFGSASAAQAAIREMIARQVDGVPLTGDDHRLAWDLLQMHPQRADKLRAVDDRPSGIVVAKAPNYPTRCLMLVGEDGTRIDYSVPVALGLKPNQPVLAAAGRNAVHRDIQAYKNAVFDAGAVVCAVSGTPLSRDSAHVDHAAPWTFEAIVAAFREAHGEPELINDGTQDLFAREEDAALFRTFHNTRVILRIVAPRVNLSALRTGLAEHAGRSGTLPW